jgi:hypothetical protein
MTNQMLVQIFCITILTCHAPNPDKAQKMLLEPKLTGALYFENSKMTFRICTLTVQYLHLK